MEQVTICAEFALSQQQDSYAVFTFGLKHHCNYSPRTLPEILGFHPRDFCLDDTIRYVGTQTNALNREIKVRK